MEEIWRPVVANPAYRVSNLGRAGGPRKAILRPGLTRNGYRFINIGGGRQPKIHRCVVEAFIGPVPDGMQINHKNGDKGDNRAENLEIVTAAENIRHRYAVLGHQPRRGVEHHNVRLTESEVREMRRLHAEGVSRFDIAPRFGITAAHVWQIIARKRWAHVD